jgi:CRISPR system Cascade subunit CasA
MPAFDLLGEPWVPVVTREGREEEIGLRDVLRRAAALREIRDPIPLVEFGLYRLLVALVMDLHGLAEITDLETLLVAGRFEERKIERYLRRWRDRFDLFHPVHPFLQTAGMAEGAEKPLAALLPIIPSGVNAAHFHHHHQDSFRVAPAVAARLLTTMAPFMTAGGPGLSPSINGAPPWYVVLHGDTLFETLCLNCCVLPLPLATGDAPPAWRDDAPPAGERAAGASLLEGLTWRPRQVQLLPGEAGLCSLTGVHADCTVARMRFARGASAGFAWTDPNVAYRIEAGAATPLRPREGRELWRDTGPLALLRQVEHGAGAGRVRFARPTVVDQFSELLRRGVLGAHPELRLTAYGLRTDLRMKVYEWQRESLALPTPLLWRSALRAEAQQAMEEAESVAATLRFAVRAAAPRPGVTAAARAAAAERALWRDLRRHYQALLEALAGLSDDAPEEARDDWRRLWRRQLRRLASGALDNAAGGLNAGAAALVRQVRARASLRRALPHLDPLPGEMAAPRR